MNKKPKQTKVRTRPENKCGCDIGACESAFDAFDILDEIITSILNSIGREDGLGEVYVIVTDDSIGVYEDGVPTEDRIKIPKRVVDECRKSVKKSVGKSVKKPASVLSKSEKDEIVRLRLLGMNVKEICRNVHRRESVVGRFLKTRKL